MKAMIKTILLGFLVLFSVMANAQQERKYIRHGNREYDKATVDSLTTDTTRYQKAEVEYRKALDKDPNNWDASYNLGNSLYKQGKFDESTKQYQAVSGMDNENKENLAKAFSNLGNSYLQSNKLSEAVEAYKSSLRNNPNDYDTKYNLAWAQNKMRQQQDQEKNQDKNKDKEDKDKQDQDKKDQDKKDQDKKEQDKKEQENKDQQQQQQQQQEQPQENKITKEDAMRILEAMQNDEKQVQEKVQKQKAQPKKRTTEKDW